MAKSTYRRRTRNRNSLMDVEEILHAAHKLNPVKCDNHNWIGIAAEGGGPLMLHMWIKQHSSWLWVDLSEDIFDHQNPERSIKKVLKANNITIPHQGPKLP